MGIVGVSIAMQITLGNIGVAISVCGVLLYCTHRIIQWLEVVTKAALLVLRRLAPDEEIPTWFANLYKRVNGNDKASRQEKLDLLGKKHDSSDGHKSARTMGLVPPEDEK